MDKIHYKSASLELTDLSEDRIVKGYASVFKNIDSDGDTLQKGAFKKTLKEWGPEGRNSIKLLQHHKLNTADPVGKIIKIQEDEKGLYFEAKFGTHTAGEDYYRMVKEGILTEFSIGFQPVEGKENKSEGYDFTEVKLYEISLVTIASNDQAVVTDVKDLKDAVESIKTIDGVKRNREVDILLSKLANAFDVEGTQPLEDSTEPLVEKQATELERLHKEFFTNEGK